MRKKYWLKVVAVWLWAWLWGLLVALDQLLNALLFGHPDETVSSRAGRGRAHWYWKWLAWILDKVDPHHCEDAIRSELEGKHLPPALRPRPAAA